MYKQYIGICRDHSGSMNHLAGKAAKDYNENISVIKEASTAHGIDTVVSVNRFGVNYGGIDFEVKNSSVNKLVPLLHYGTYGNTPLFDAVGEMIKTLETVPDKNDPDVSFLVMVITDGEENASRKYNGTTLSMLIKQLQNTNRWTFAFRVPPGHAKILTRLGIPEGNILEWEQTVKGIERSTDVTKASIQSFYSGRASGQRSTSSFYTDLSSVTASQVKAEMTNISSKVSFWDVFKEGQIKDFVEGKLGKPMQLGCAFYQLMKPEKVQGYKLLCIRNKKNGEVYAGDAARDLLGLPRTGEIRLRPGNHGDFDVFIQSTSTNRKLVPGTEILYWPNAKVL